MVHCLLDVLQFPCHSTCDFHWIFTSTLLTVCYRQMDISERKMAAKPGLCGEVWGFNSEPETLLEGVLWYLRDVFEGLGNIKRCSSATVES